MAGCGFRLDIRWRVMLAALMAVGVLAGCSQMAARPMPAPAEVVLGNAEFAVTIRTDGSELRPEFGLRFDETAWVTQVTLGGRTFLRPGYGLLDEFGLTGVGVLGYDEVPEGGKFVKIGVGRLIRPDDMPYRFWLQRQLDEAATTRREVRAGVLRTTQTIGRGEAYGYSYRKCYRVDPATATLRIEYQLTNRGTREFTFDQYDHNWLSFSQQVIDARYHVATDFRLSGPAECGKWLKRTGPQLTIIAPVAKPDCLTSTAQTDARTNRFVVQGPDGQQMVVSGDFGVHDFRLYAQPEAICPEVTYQARVEPGQTVAWTRTYQFVISEKKSGRDGP